MAIKWTDRLAIDHGLIDQDHRAIIDVANSFLTLRKDAGKAEMASVLSDLEHYARSHFWRESQLQAKIGFCHAERQAEEHMRLVSALAAVVLRFHQARDAESLKVVVDEIGALLHGWLIDHILQSDIDMAAYRSEIAALTQGMKPLHRDSGRTIGTGQIMSIDNGIIDDDHGRLVDIINAFIVATAEDVETAYLSRTLAHLVDYTHSHFSREEALQTAVGYPFAAAHQQAHRQLILSLAGFGRMLAGRGDAGRAREELCALLKTWLLDHVGEQDARMRPYVEEMRGPSRKLRPFPPVRLW
jgi:hemerythrin-like metal-binding protein